MQRTRSPRPLQARPVAAHWLLQPVAPGDELVPAGRPGLLSIETEPGVGSTYMVTILTDRAHAVLGYRLTKPDGVTYDLPANLASCECKDWLYRGQYRVGGCKHTAGVRQALAALDPWAGWDEITYAPTTAAIAAELVIDFDHLPHAGCTCRNEREHRNCPPARAVRYEQPDWFDGGDFDPAA